MTLDNKTIERLKTTYGSWVLITGATSGIGKELSICLGKSGFNLVIIGRRKSVLDDLKANILVQYNNEVIVVAGDLTKSDDLENLISITQSIPIGILILNAGYGTSGKFIHNDIGQELNLLQLNCESVIKLTHVFANRMKNDNRRGAIVLLSSIVGFQGAPYAANYAASKAYVQSFGEAIAKELKDDDIDVLCAAPGPVKSGFEKRANMKMGNALKPEKVILPIIKSIGIRSKVFPGLLTKFLYYNLSLLPRWARVLVMGNIMKSFTKHQKHI